MASIYNPQVLGLACQREERLLVAQLSGPAGSRSVRVALLLFRWWRDEGRQVSPRGNEQQAAAASGPPRGAQRRRRLGRPGGGGRRASLRAGGWLAGLVVALLGWLGQSWIKMARSALGCGLRAEGELHGADSRGGALAASWRSLDHEHALATSRVARATRCRCTGLPKNGECKMGNGQRGAERARARRHCTAAMVLRREQAGETYRAILNYLSASLANHPCVLPSPATTCSTNTHTHRLALHAKLSQLCLPVGPFIEFDNIIPKVPPTRTRIRHTPGHQSTVDQPRDQNERKKRKLSFGNRSPIANVPIAITVALLQSRFG